MGVRNVMKIKDEPQTIKIEESIEDRFVKDEADVLIKDEIQSIKSESEDSEEKHWDSSLHASETDADEPDGVTVFDIVAGRLGEKGFIEDDEEEEPISIGQYLVSRQNEVAPDQMFRPFGTTLNPRHSLPNSDLLKAIHTHASDFYGALEDSEDAEDDFQSMEETALLAMGILMEETADEILGQEGFLTFLERPRRSRRRAETAEIKDEQDIKEEKNVEVKVEVKTESELAKAKRKPRPKPKAKPNAPVVKPPKIERRQSGYGEPKSELALSEVDLKDIEEYRPGTAEGGQDQQVSAPQEEPATSSRQGLQTVPQEEPQSLPEDTNGQQAVPQAMPRSDEREGQPDVQGAVPQDMTGASRQELSHQGYHSDVSSWISQTFQHPQDDPNAGPADRSRLPCR
jgi:hypothetical protein